jgi:hypothetical protein
VSRLKCPQCGTIVDVMPGQTPVCPNCGYGAQPTAPSLGGYGGTAQMPYTAGAQGARRPGGVAVYDFILCGLLFLAGLVLLLAGGAIATALEEAGVSGALADLTGAILAVIGVVALALGVLYLFLGLGMLKGQKWSWIVQIIFAVLGALSGLASLVQGSIADALWSFAVSGLILWAMFHPKSMAWFNRGTRAPQAAYG